MKGVVCFSGGMDSTAVLNMAVQECKEGVMAVSFKYGSKHNEQEYAAAQRVLEFYGEMGYEIKHRMLTLPEVFGYESALMHYSATEMPASSYAELAGTLGPSPTVVPFRNGNMLSIAAAIAVVEHSDRIYAGMHAEDARGWAYPDCSTEFLGSMAAAIYIGTYMNVRLVVPFQHEMKKDIVRYGYENGVPFDLTRSCYDPKHVDPEILPCGTCPTCVERIQAFKDNGLIDPADYAIEIDWGNADPYA